MARAIARHDRADRRLGTFLPFLCASARPITMACLRLFTVLRLLPLFSVPFLRLRRSHVRALQAPLGLKHRLAMGVAVRALWLWHCCRLAAFVGTIIVLALLLALQRERCEAPSAIPSARVAVSILVLLRQTSVFVFWADRGLVQHGHRSSVAARYAAILTRISTMS